MRHTVALAVRPAVALVVAAALLSVAGLGCGAYSGPKYADRSYRTYESPPPPAEQQLQQEDAKPGAYYQHTFADDQLGGSLFEETKRAPKKSVDKRYQQRAEPPAKGQAQKEPDARGLDKPFVVYLGFLKLRVQRLLETIDRVVAITEEAGGYVESLGSKVVVVRIPAGDFDTAMDTFAALGDVLSRRIKALDVSAQFTDLVARLGVAKESRARLLELLEKVDDVQERLRILQEVKRLTEQIESIESTLATLQNLVDYFTITIELEPVRSAAATTTHVSPFVWVRELRAHVRTTSGGKDQVAQDLPDGFVLFAEDDDYRAQSADTTTIRVGRVENDPRGDAGFWSDAIRHEMDGRDEELLHVGEAGDLKLLVFRNKDVEPRYYLLAVSASPDREHLYAVEVFYPNKGSYERHHAAVLRSLQTFRVKK